jgi:hypothetical protein
MAGTYLTDLAQVLRSAGLTVIDVPGWQNRARSSGGYVNGRPTHLMLHHTASAARTDGQDDVNYIVNVAADRPITNLYLDRFGRFWACAAGATNTNGKGVDTWGGGVPNDRMNEYAISIEMANNGVGEPYPQVQQDAVMRASIALCVRYRIPSEFVRSHFEWAPTRKIDVSGPSRWAAIGKWNMGQYRSDVRLGIIAPLPAPDPDEDDMALICYIATPPADRPGAPWLFVYNGDVRYCTSHDTTVVTDHRPLNSEQYGYLRKCAGI